jgi:hypothetical protein
LLRPVTVIHASITVAFDGCAERLPRSDGAGDLDDPLIDRRALARPFQGFDHVTSEIEDLRAPSLAPILESGRQRIRHHQQPPLSMIHHATRLEADVRGYAEILPRFRERS